MAANLKEDAYRKEQLEFISNIHGTTAREIILVILPSVCSLLLMVTTFVLIGKYLNRITRFIIEFIIVLLPTILCFTVYSDSKISVCMALLVASVINLLVLIFTSNSARSGRYLLTHSARRPFLTNFRSLTGVLTAICILAVDFKVFPRRYAKTEVYGFSLMDTGVGFFIMSNALVSPEAKDSGQNVNLGFVKTAAKNCADCVRSCIPLLVLGSVRYFSIEYLNYQRHVDEYGVHWNFFVTLAAVKILTTIVTTVLSSRYSLIVGIFIITVYEFVLSQNNVRQWLFSHSREGFINANKEGLVSTLGYVGLYFIGVAIGRLIHSTYQRASKSQTDKFKVDSYFCIKIFGYTIDARYTESMILCIKLSLIAAQACAAMLFLNSYSRVSRKLANAGYCVWMVTLSTTMLTLLVLIDVITDILKQLSAKEDSGKKTSKVIQESYQLSSIPEILEAVNYNGLPFFLVCNLITGGINLTIKTLYVPDNEALQIITAYVLVSTALFAILYRYKIQIKF